MREKSESIAVKDPVQTAFLTVSEAANYLRLSRAKLYLMMDMGELTYAKFGRSRRIPQQALTDLVKKSLVTR
jgi:excisionase family DNA binding protein